MDRVLSVNEDEQQALVYDSIVPVIEEEDSNNSELGGVNPTNPLTLSSKGGDMASRASVDLNRDILDFEGTNRKRAESLDHN